MYLSKEEEKLLDSDNKTIAKLMEILVALGKIYNAERLIPIFSSHISGISYQNIGDEGLEWLESLDARVVVKTSVNPAGMDLLRWKKMVDEEFYLKQIRIINALKKLGADITLTCTPYYIYEIEYGMHLAWAESSAIVYANSVVGARTNRESGVSALASAIIGKTPFYGLHIKSNRAPNVLVKAGNLDPSALGFKLGRMLRHDQIPIFRFKRRLSNDELKLLGASLAATGNVAIFHVENQTPEWKDFETPNEKIEIDEVEMENDCDPDLIALGCPHLSKDELLQVLKLLEREGKRVKKKFWLFTSREVAIKNKRLIEKIESFNVEVFCDTCMVVSPVTEKYECVMVNSGKALAYLPKLRHVNAKFGNLEECVKVALGN